VTGKVAGEDSDMTIIIGKKLRPQIHSRTRPFCSCITLGGQ